MLTEMIQIMRKLHSAKIPLVPAIISRFLRVTYACDISPTANISSSVVLHHGGLGCVFHENVVIEDGVKIYQNVTLGGSGRLNTGLKRGCDHPYIKKGATIYAGACVLGPIVVGENAVVGANAVVLQDVPPNTLAVGVPAVIKSKKE